MRYTTAVIGTGIALLAGTACATQDPSPPPGDGERPAAGAEQPAAHQPPPPEPVPPERVDATSLPASFPKDVGTSQRGRMLVIRAQEGGCGKASAELPQQNARQVTVNLVETKPGGNPMCTMDIRYPTLTVQLAQPLDERSVVLRHEERTE